MDRAHERGQPFGGHAARTEIRGLRREPHPEREAARRGLHFRARLGHGSAARRATEEYPGAPRAPRVPLHLRGLRRQRGLVRVPQGAQARFREAHLRHREGRRAGPRGFREGRSHQSEMSRHGDQDHRGIRREP